MELALVRDDLDPGRGLNAPEVILQRNTVQPNIVHVDIFNVQDPYHLAIFFNSVKFIILFYFSEYRVLLVSSFKTPR